MKTLKKLWNQRWMLRSIFSTIFFNFYYLPFKQAIRLPILLYRPKLLSMGGRIILDSSKIHFGMIHLGRPLVPIYPSSPGIIFQNGQGLIRFEGTCRIGSNSAISVGKDAQLSFGDDFIATTTLKIVCCKSINFGSECIFGWDCLVLDTNFHPLYDLKNEVFKPSFGPIHIGKRNWFANQTVIMHSVTTPDQSVYGLRSVLTRGGNYESRAVHGGNPAKVLSKNIILDYQHKHIPSYENDEIH